MARSPSLCGIILAAGASSRMGRDKALLPWPAGRPGGLRNTLLGAWIELLRPHTDMVIVVGGANSRNLEPVVYSIGGFLVENRAPELGQFNSLRVGLHEILGRGRDSAIVALVDRPPVQPATMDHLYSAFLGALDQSFWAVIPEYDEHHGHPILLAREMIEVLLRAQLTATARDILHANATHISYVPVEDARVAMNINTQEDYDRLAVENA
ncbi:MAG: nucleotidyltransferase family protein [Candidatus Korobacteraceae bacterium]